MIKSSALLATAALAADSVNNYTGTIPGQATAVAPATQTQGSLSDLDVKVQVDQKAKQVTYDYSVSGTFGEAQSERTNLDAGLCYKVGETYDCTLLKYEAAWNDDNGTNDGYSIVAYRATGVSAADAVLTTWEGFNTGVIKWISSKSDTTCATKDKIAEMAAGAKVWTVDTETTGLCATIALNKDKQAVNAAAKTFTMQVTVTPLESEKEEDAVALLTAFKTASTTMRGGFVYGFANYIPVGTNEALSLKFTEVAEPDAAKPDAAEPDAAEPDAAEPDAAAPDAAAPGATTTFAVAIAAAAALF